MTALSSPAWAKGQATVVAAGPQVGATPAAAAAKKSGGAAAAKPAKRVKAAKPGKPAVVAAGPQVGATPAAAAAKKSGGAAQGTELTKPPAAAAAPQVANGLSVARLVGSSVLPGLGLGVVVSPLAEPRPAAVRLHAGALAVPVPLTSVAVRWAPMMLGATTFVPSVAPLIGQRAPEFLASARRLVSLPTTSRPGAGLSQAQLTTAAPSMALRATTAAGGGEAGGSPRAEGPDSSSPGGLSFGPAGAAATAGAAASAAAGAGGALVAVLCGVLFFAVGRVTRLLLGVARCRSVAFVAVLERPG